MAALNRRVTRPTPPRRRSSATSSRCFESPIATRLIAAFDLWSFADVKANADRILGAVRSGSVPCDMEWPDERVELLQRWIDAGTPE
jgi:hypothetical protein